MTSKYFYTNVYQKRDKICLIGYLGDKRIVETIDYKPYLFLPGPGPFKTLEGTSAQKVEFDSLGAARDFIKHYEGVSNIPFYGMTNFKYPFINDHFPGKVDYDPRLIRINFIDIEVDSKNGMPNPMKGEDEVTAITLVRGDKIITFGTKYYLPKNPKVVYVLYEDERRMLNDFLNVWESDEWVCDVVSGWYSDRFDMPYLINRIERILGTDAMLRLSPWRIVDEKDVVRGKSTSNSSKNIENRTDKIYEIAGISQLDYIQLYKKFTSSSRDSYRLDNIAFLELGERKLDYSEFESLNDLYEKDPERYYDYNIHDAVLVQKLEEKLGFLRQIFAMAYKAKVNLNDAFVTVKPWDVILHNYLLERGIVIPQNKPQTVRDFSGGFVLDPQIGLSHDVISFDFRSLYPSLISQHNISPETFLTAGFNRIPEFTKFDVENWDGATEYLQDKNLTLCANKCVYRRDIRGFIPAIVDQFISDRDVVKQEMLEMQKSDNPDKNKIGQLDSYQNALKILTNGLYGALSNEYCRWFDINLAESVTLTGQLYIKWVMRNINIYLNKVLKTEGQDFIVAGDTDSLYIKVEAITKALEIAPEKKLDFIDALCKKKLEPFIDKQCADLARMLNSYNNVVKMKREVIAAKAIWRGKKMYVMSVLDKEGVRYDPPKLLYKGIEVARSDKPKACRDHMKEALNIIMFKDEKALHDLVKKFKLEFMRLSVMDIALPKTVNGIEDYFDPVFRFKPHCPIHVRGAIVYNEQIDKYELKNKFNKIKSRDKIRFVYLKEPNIFRSHVLTLPDEGFLPKQINVDKYVDRVTQWEKTFLNPVQSITSVIGWNTEKKATLGAALG
jgi:DNA polymerase elongation subunit (family B)